MAVLPVANLSGDPEQEYFSDGMTDALIADLSRIGALKVISRTSVMQYKAVKKTLPEIGRDLHVEAILAWYFLLFDRVEEAIEEHQRAKELDPFNPLHVAWLGEIYRMNGQLDEAEAEALKSIEMSSSFPPGYFVLGKTYETKGMHDEAIAAIQKAAEASPVYRWALGPAYVAAGRRDEAVRLLEELRQQKVTPWTAFWLAVSLAVLGDLDGAFRWLNHEPHHAWVP